MRAMRRIKFEWNFGGNSINQDSLAEIKILEYKKIC